MNPHTRAIGGTFQFAFILPKPANPGNTHPHKRRASEPGRQTQAGSVNRKSATKPTRPRLTDEQMRELRRVHASENRQRRKELGLCKDLPKPGNQRADPLPALRRDTPANAEGPAQIGRSGTNTGMSGT